LRFSRGAEGN